jgi:hypothetical protein
MENKKQLNNIKLNYVTERELGLWSTFCKIRVSESVTAPEKQEERNVNCD